MESMFYTPLWQRGGEGGFFGKEIIHKISPTPLFQRGDLVKALRYQKLICEWCWFSSAIFEMAHNRQATVYRVRYDFFPKS
jgi:hypothetical protein